MKKIFLSFLCLLLPLFMLCACSLPFFNIGTKDEDDGTLTQPPEECTVSFVTKAGYDIDPVTVKNGETCKAPIAPSRRGARFLGWYLGETKWNFTSDKVTEDLTLTAKWEMVNYTIIYDLGGGSYDGEMPASYTVESETLTLGTPVREDYEFLGWTINGKETNEIKMGSTGNMTVKANWFGLEAAVLPAKDGAKGIVVFIHDDARLPTMEIMDGLLEKYGLVGDVGFLLSKVVSSNGTVNTTELEKYRAYIDNGRWSIVNHSATHNWWGMESTDESGNITAVDDPDRLEYEVVTSQAKMRELFPGQRVLTFAYPGFSAMQNKYTDGTTAQLKQIIYSPAARRLIEQHHIGARFYSGGSTTIGSDIDWNWMNTSFLSASFIENQLPSLLQSSVKNGTLNVLSFHGATDDTEVHDSDPGYYLMDTELETAMELVSTYVDTGEIWNTHYEDAVLYLREAEASELTVKKDGSNILLTLTDGLDDEIYNAPLTVRITNFGDAKMFRVVQNGKTSYISTKTVDGVEVVELNIIPDSGTVTLTPASAS